MCNLKQSTITTGSLEKGLVLAGLRLQRDSQKLVPVDTGNLKGSAFTRLDKNTEKFFDKFDASDRFV